MMAFCVIFSKYWDPWSDIVTTVFRLHMPTLLPMALMTQLNKTKHLPQLPHTLLSQSDSGPRFGDFVNDNHDWVMSDGTMSEK